MAEFAAVVGAVNIDIWGQTDAAIIPQDSNPGVIRFAPGGVGRNIARNLALLGTDVTMLTALGDDIWASTLEADLRRGGIDISHAVRVPGAGTSAYLYISDPAGEMQLAVCDAEIVAQISPAYLEENLSLLNRAALVIPDGNLSEEAIAFLAEKCSSPLFVDPVSVTKARKFRSVLHRIHTIKPNAAEAMELTGEKVPESAALALTAMGVRRAFVSDGDRGIVAAEGKACVRIPCCTASLRNCNGGGDAVMAALCRSYLDGRGLTESARYAMAAGAIAVESTETIAEEMNETNVLARMGNL